ncbi:MAG: hypothetical protein ACYTHJ_10105 [Planctomycetota bacterium]|jgi:hypothetical protein
MTLTMNRDVDHYIDQQLRTYPLAGGVHVFQGAMLGVTPAGFARPLVGGDLLAGLAYEEIVNTAGANGDLHIRAFTMGDFGLPLAGALPSDLGRPVFASDDDTLTYQSAGNSYVGTVQNTTSNGEVVLRLQTMRQPVQTMTHAVENLSAGIDIVPRAIHAAVRDGWIVAARVVNQSGPAVGINDANPCVITLGSSAGSIGAITFNSSTPFPGVNAHANFGLLSNARFGASDVITLTVNNGSTANPGAFLVEVDFV